LAELVEGLGDALQSLPRAPALPTGDERTRGLVGIGIAASADEPVRDAEAFESVAQRNSTRSCQ